MRLPLLLVPALLLAGVAQAATAGKPLPESDPAILTVAPIADTGSAWIGGIDRGRGTRWLALCANRSADAKAWSDCTFLGLEIEPDFISASRDMVAVYDKQARMQTCIRSSGPGGWTCRPAERVQLPFYNCPAGVIC